MPPSRKNQVRSFFFLPPSYPLLSALSSRRRFSPGLAAPRVVLRASRAGGRCRRHALAAGVARPEAAAPRALVAGVARLSTGPRGCAWWLRLEERLCGGNSEALLPDLENT
ncbi:hypothetical protein GUJ93_ZPchr0014g47330 [Zizania palustris]|uniref:Uncharacterized protein n=1 Tax=Zizania palustris TaxID=103762 RepID=A0A8J5TL05_ZIZPA|nr:hypothetical protein GUJ93_ZPchr0014g47330 [Zizania palustris]